MTHDLYIHQNPDARAWAKFFMETKAANPGFVIDEEIMIGWFANAMMAMHDHLMIKGQPINGDHAQHILDQNSDDHDLMVGNYIPKKSCYKLATCPECHGEGRGSKREFDGYSTGFCEDCGGTGRMLTEVTENDERLLRITALSLSKILHSQPLDVAYAARTADRIVELTSVALIKGQV